MGDLRTRPLVVTIGVAVLFALTACSTTSDETAAPSSSPSASSPESTAPAEQIDFGTAPTSAGVPACADLLPDDAVRAVVPDAALVDEVQVAHLRGIDLAATAIGGASCLATNGVAPFDDTTDAQYGDPVFSGVALVVVPDSAPEYRAIETSLREQELEAGGTTCSATDSARVSCTGTALVGDAWLYLRATRDQDSVGASEEQLTAPFEALVERARSTVASSGVAAVHTDHDPAEVRRTRCSPGNVGQVSDSELVWPEAGTDSLPSPQDVALDRLDGDSCTFGTPPTRDRGYIQPRAQYDHLPGAGWIVQERLADGTIDRAGRVELDGLGQGDAAWRTCDDAACSLDVVRDGGDWEHFVLSRAVSPNASGAIERWAVLAAG